MSHPSTRMRSTRGCGSFVSTTRVAGRALRDFSTPLSFFFFFLLLLLLLLL